MKNNRYMLGIVVALLMLIVHSIMMPASVKASEPFQLYVSLYPWVPESKSLVQWIETDFEAKHPSIDLVIRQLEKSDRGKPEYVGDLAYEIDKTTSALTTKDSDFQHLVEIDTMILGALVEREAVSKFDISKTSFLPAASEAVTYDGTKYGIPHWTCGYFVISEDGSIRKAKNLNALISTLKSFDTKRVNLVGDLDGSWDSIMLYLDAFRDTYPERSMLEAASHTKLDPVVAESFRSIGSECSTGTENFCGEDGVKRFAKGNADALLGYSERLNPILADSEKKVNNLHIASATLGDGDEPTLFTDALVLSPLCSTKQCKDAALEFASYYVSDETFEVLLMALDEGDSAIPRYLLPSTRSAFKSENVHSDRLYQEMEVEIKGAKPYPNQGIPEARESGLIRKQLKEVLGL